MNSPTNTPPAISALPQRMQRLLQGLRKGIYEKDEAIGLGLLAAVAGESLFLLGPPGVAKSLIARRLKYAFRNGKSFEYLMSKFSTPDELFGPVSIKKLKDEDRYERLTDRYMPGAQVVFLDEIWKAGPSIQNALLTIVNEKIYRNGEADVPVSIHLIVSASNELPPRQEGLEALWDRFLIRYTIGEVRDRGNFLSMITQTGNVYEDHVPEEDKISAEELEAWGEAIDRVGLPQEVLNTLQVLKSKLEAHDAQAEHPFQIYDRRWKKAVRLLRTSAFLNGREEVDLMDCFLLSHCLWSTPYHQDVLHEAIASTIRKHGYSVAMNLSAFRKEVEEFGEEVRAETQVPVTATVAEPYLVEGKFYEVLLIGNIMEGQYIKASEFERLGLGEESTIGLYDGAFKLIYRMRAKRAPEENTLLVTHNAQTQAFSLRAEQREVTRLLPRKPHRAVVDYWNGRFRELSEYAAGLQAHLDAHLPAMLDGLRRNLFVSPELAPIVEANLHESANALRAATLQLEQTHHYYTETLHER
jgi:MoxR-like ATPase